MFVIPASNILIFAAINKSSRPDIQQEGPGVAIMWISGRENGQIGQKRCRISTQTSLDGRFDGYPVAIVLGRAAIDTTNGNLSAAVLERKTRLELYLVIC